MPQKPTLKFPRVPLELFSYMDLVGELPITAHGYLWVLVVQDYMTKCVLLFPITNKDALTIAALLVYEVFYKFGFPKKLQSGQGSESNKLLLRIILEAAEVTQSISSAYQHMSQGSVERFNGTMNTYISRLLKPEEEHFLRLVAQKSLLTMFLVIALLFSLLAKCCSNDVLNTLWISFSTRKRF